MDLSAADQIWNRAAMKDGGASPGRGDQALAAMLSLHGLVMNGGPHHAIDLLSTEELAAAIDGFSYFGFDDMATWLKYAPSDPLLKEWTDETETPAVFRYAELIPDDAFLVKRFEAALREKPEDFAPT